MVGGKSTDIFIIDLNLPDENGLSLTRRIRNVNPNLVIIEGVSTQNDRIFTETLGHP